MLKAVLCLMVLMSVCNATLAEALDMNERTFISVATGEMGGVYFPLGGGLCRLVNKNHAVHGIKCNVESTGGAIHNLNLLGKHSVDLIFAQTDWVDEAVKGGGDFAVVDSLRNLRTAMYLHKEYFTVVVREDSKINKFSDIVGSRVNVGAPGTGVNATVQVLLDLKKWDKDSFQFITRLDMSEQGQALCDGKIDVAFYVVGHPSGVLREASAACGIRILPVNDEEVLSFVDASPTYERYKIPGGIYQGNPKDINTFGVRTVLVTEQNVSEEVVYQVVKSVVENFESFRGLHPVLLQWHRDQIVGKDSKFSLRMHQGAIRYYQEVGLL